MSILRIDNKFLNICGIGWGDGGIGQFGKGLGSMVMVWDNSAAFLCFIHKN